MAYPIHNWRDDSKYPRDPFAAAPVAFIEKRQKCGYSKAKINSVFWHWEFLRRHPWYQEHWENESVEYFLMFGVCGTFRPHPKTNCPADLLFRHELFHEHLRYPTMLDAGKSWPENQAREKPQYDSLRGSKSAFELFMASGYMPWPELTGTRKRSIHVGKYPTLLRALDALAAGETLSQIAQEIRPGLDEKSYHNTVTRWREDALDLQAAFTGLPRMDDLTSRPVSFCQGR